MNKEEMIKALRNAAQSASNTVAGNISSPIDAIAWGLRKTGVPIPEDAVGGSLWMNQKGLTLPVEDGNPKLVGEAIGLTVPALIGAKIANPKAIEYFKRGQ